MKLIYVCSPLRGDIENNIEKAKQYCKYVVRQGHIPIAPHVMLDGILNDSVDSERDMALSMGQELVRKCDELWWFGDRISDGMAAEIARAANTNTEVTHVEMLDCIAFGE